MRLKLFLQSICFCFVFVIFISAQNGEAEISALLKDAAQKSDENWRKMHESFPNYSYKWRRAWRTADKKGKITERSELYEVFLPLKCADKKCRAVGILLEEDGKKVSDEKIEKQRIKAGEKLEKMEGEKDAQSYPRKREYPNTWMMFSFFRRRPLSDEYETIVKIDAREILEKCEFFAAAKEQINGREAIALKFRPRAGAAFSREMNYVRNSEGKIWIDAEERVIFRLAVWQKNAKFEKETSDWLLEHAAVVYDMTRTPERLWLFRLGEFRGLKNPALLAEMKDDFSLENFDHRFFKTEIKNVELERSK